MSNLKHTRRAFLRHGAIASASITLAAAKPSKRTAVEPVQLAGDEKLRIAILGCGNHSPAHIRAINYYSDRMEVAALCDIVPEKLEEKKELVESGSPELYTDYEKMLAGCENLHAVAVVLPNTVHRVGTVASLDTGKHVLCEKPLTLKLDDTKAIIDAADRTGRIVQVGTQSRHAPGYQLLADKIRNGLIGNPLYGWAQMFRVDWLKLYPDPEVDSRKNWRMKQDQGGSVVHEMGIHTIDVFNWFIDSDPIEVSALGGVHNGKLQKRTAWDHAGVVVRYANGAMMTYGGNLYCCDGPGPDFLFGDKASLEIGSRTTTDATVYERAYWRPFGKGVGPVSKEVIELPDMEARPSTLQYAHFYEAVQGKKKDRFLPRATICPLY